MMFLKWRCCLFFWVGPKINCAGYLIRVTLFNSNQQVPEFSRAATLCFLLWLGIVGLEGLFPGVLILFFLGLFAIFFWGLVFNEFTIAVFPQLPLSFGKEGRKGGGCWLRGAPVAPLLVDHHWASHKICDDGYINYCIYWTNKKRFGSLLFGSTSILMHSYFAVLCPFLVLFYN